MLYPLHFKPVYQDYIWGGDRIIRHFDRDEPPGVYAESWEVSDRPEGLSVVANGPLAGKTLAELVKEYGADLLGTRSPIDRFPLLIKILDPKQVLSVQVHPNDETAAKFGGEPKTEMWYVLESDPGAQVYAGFKPGVTELKFDGAVEAGNVNELLNTIPVTKGDVVYIKGGRIHAIDEGSLLLEVQQNSNTTYRVFDWNRVGADGQSRELHVERAKEVLAWSEEESPKVEPKLLEAGANKIWEVLTTPYFRLEKWELHEPLSVPSDSGTFQVLFCADGECILKEQGIEYTCRPGTSWLLPATLEGVELAPDPITQLLRITVPPPPV